MVDVCIWFAGIVIISLCTQLSPHNHIDSYNSSWWLFAHLIYIVPRKCMTALTPTIPFPSLKKYGLLKLVAHILYLCVPLLRSWLHHYPLGNFWFYFWFSRTSKSEEERRGRRRRKRFRNMLVMKNQVGFLFKYTLNYELATFKVEICVNTSSRKYE